MKKTKIVVWNCHRHSQKKNLIETNVSDSKLRSPGGNPTPHSSDVFALCVAWIFLSYLRCIGLCTICSSVVAFYFILYSAPPLPMATHQARKENFEQTCHSWWSTRWPELFGKTSPGRNTNPRHDVCTSNFQVLWVLSGLGLVRGWQVGSSFRSFFPFPGPVGFRRPLCFLSLGFSSARSVCVGVCFFPFFFPRFLRSDPVGYSVFNRFSFSHDLRVFEIFTSTSFIRTLLVPPSWVRVCAYVCVCVEHLNRCKTSHPYCHSRGVQSTVETAPNEAIHLCWKQSLINSVYLLFQLRRYFCCNGTGLSR